MYARGMHKRRAGAIAEVTKRAEDAGMDAARTVVVEAVRPLVSTALALFGFGVYALLIVVWCLLVLVLTGRLPWMVRKYL